MVHNDKIWVMKVFTGSSRINAWGFSWAYSGLVWVFLSDSLRSPIREGLRLGGRGLRAGSFERITEAERRQLKSKADFQCRFVWLSSQLLTKLIHPWVDGHSFGCDLTASQDWKLNTNSCVCVWEGGGREGGDRDWERGDREETENTEKRSTIFFSQESNSWELLFRTAWWQLFLRLIESTWLHFQMSPLHSTSVKHRLVSDPCLVKNLQMPTGWGSEDCNEEENHVLVWS